MKVIFSLLALCFPTNAYGYQALSSCIGRYPGYTGPYDVSGSKVKLEFDGEAMLFKPKVIGAEADCDNCGIHIHTGVTCDDAALVGGHYWDAAKTEDLWTTAGGAIYNTTKAGNSYNKFNLTNGYGAEGNVNHAVVIHAQDGSRIGCGLLSHTKEAANACERPDPLPKINLETCISKYPGYEGNITVSGKVRARYYTPFGGRVTIRYNLVGADPDCTTCGLHIHTGTTCDDAALVGGHYWDADIVEDQWTTDGGAIYTTDSSGSGKGFFKINAGYNATANVGHAVVVHDKETGARVGCGVLTASKKVSCF